MIYRFDWMNLKQEDRVFTLWTAKGPFFDQVLQVIIDSSSWNKK